MKIKLLILLFACMTACKSYAGFITFEADQDSYNAGDEVTVDFFLNNANPVIDFLEVEYLFDDVALGFDMFAVTADVFANTTFDFAFDDFGLLIIQVGFLAGWDSFLGTSFQLGSATFTALENGVGADLTLGSILAQDAAFNDVEPSVESTNAVPAPAAIWLLSLSLVFAGVVRKRQ